MHLSLLLKAFYLICTIGILAANLFTPLKQRFFAYGPRSSDHVKRNDAQKHAESTSDDPTTRLLNLVAALKVPHSWFSHFYLTSVLASLFWGIQFLSNGRILQALVETNYSPLQETMTFEQVQLAWALLLTQGLRRLYECLTLQKPSSSSMWSGQWLLGIAFYLATSMSVWIEGISALQANTTTTLHNLTLIKPPTLRTSLALPLFIIASGLQHDCHAYLASLEKYTLPDQPMFQAIVCPHYFAECLIYLSLAIIAAPRGSWLNGTLACALLFVGANLGVTADGTRRWYVERFGRERVVERWRMVPFVY